MLRFASKNCFLTFNKPCSPPPPPKQFFFFLVFLLLSLDFYTFQVEKLYAKESRILPEKLTMTLLIAYFSSLYISFLMSVIKCKEKKKDSQKNITRCWTAIFLNDFFFFLKWHYYALLFLLIISFCIILRIYYRRVYKFKILDLSFWSVSPMKSLFIALL